MSEKPKILLLDVETQPDLVWVWKVYEADAIDVKQHWQLLSYSAKWFGTNIHVTKGLPDYRGYRPGGGDKALVKDLWKLLNEADIVVGHNLVQFDIKKVNARMIAHGLTPPSPYRTVDTLRAVKQVSAYSSNKLDWLCHQLDLGRKIKHQGWSMWKGCMVGESLAWKRMLMYNRHDVILLERLYKLIAPWIRQPSAAAYSGDERCVNPACFSKDIHVYPGLYHVNTRTYRRFQCKACGRWARAVLSERTPKATLVGV